MESDTSKPAPAGGAGARPKVPPAAGAGKQPVTMLNDRVLVNVPQSEGERRSRAGILIPATAQVQRRLAWAEVAAVGPHVRTPTGPSDILKPGRPMAGMERVNMPSMPPSSSIFSSSVSLESIAWACASMAGESGTGAWAASCRQSDKIDAKTRAKRQERGREK